MNGNSHHICTDYTVASEAEGARLIIIRNIDKPKKMASSISQNHNCLLH